MSRPSNFSLKRTTLLDKEKEMLEMNCEFVYVPK